MFPLSMSMDNLRVEIGVTDRVVDVIGKNIDCAIRSTARDLSLITRRIGKLGWTTCASPAYLARYGTPDHPSELLNGNYPVAGYFSALTRIVQPLHFLDQGQPSGSSLAPASSSTRAMRISRRRWRAWVLSTRWISWCVPPSIVAS